MSFAISSTLVQSTPSLTLTLSSNTPQWHRLTYQLHPAFLGLKAIGGLSSLQDTTNFNYFYFPVFNFLLAEKKTATVVTTVSFGSTVSTQDYVSMFKLSQLRIYNQSSSLQTNPTVPTNSITDSSFTLTPRASLTASSVTLLQGLSSPGSNGLYSMSLTVPKILDSGLVKISPSSANYELPDDRQHQVCLPRSSLALGPSSKNVLCRALGSFAFALEGMAELTSGTTITVQLYLKAKTVAAATSFTVLVLGVKDDPTTEIVSQTVSGPAISGSAASQLTPLYQFNYVYSYTTTTAYQAITGNLQLSLGTSAGQQITVSLSGSLPTGSI